MWRSHSTWVSLLMMALLSGAAEAQETVPLETFLAMSPQALKTAQMKLIYLGPSIGLLPAMVMTIHGRPVDWDAFVPWLGHGQGIDEFSHQYSGNKPTMTVSVEEMRAVIQNLKHIVDAINKTVSDTPTDPWLSITLTAGQQGSIKGIKLSFDDHEAKDFFVLMRGSLRADPKDITLLEGQANIEAMRTLQGWGCAIGLLPEAIPATDVSARVRVTTGGLRWNASTKRFECFATLTNISTEPIKGPIALVVIPSIANVSLANAHGTTCMTTPVGREFLNVPMPAQVLEPSATLETTLEFEHEEGAGIAFNTKVLAGVGER